MNLLDYAAGLQGQLTETERRLTNLLDAITGPVPEKAMGQSPTEAGLLGRLKSISQIAEQISVRISGLEQYLANQNQACLAQQAPRPMGVGSVLRN